MITLEDAVSQFNIKKGERIWLSADVTELALLFRRQGQRLDANALLDEFIKAVGPEGTLLVPTFNFDFSNHGFYDYNGTKCTTGALGTAALKRPDFTRTLHPLHSFAVWGADKEHLVSMDNNNSFGTDSPFGYCIQRHVKQIFLGTDYAHGLTLMHYAESVCNVPYRYMKTFHGTYTDASGNTEERSYIYPVRQLEISPEECSNLMGAILEQKGLSVKTELEGITSYMLGMDRIFPVLCDDIINNQCRNLYTFNIPREEVFGRY